MNEQFHPIKIKKNSASDLFNRILLSDDSIEIDNIRSEIHRRVSKGDMHFPFYESLVATKGNLAMSSIYKLSRECKLFKDAISFSDKTPNFKVSAARQKMTLNKISAFFHTLERLHGYTRLIDINFNSWESIISELKDEQDKYKSDLKDIYKTVTRKAALLLTTCHNDVRFKLAAVDKKINSHLGSILSEKNINPEIKEWHDAFSEYLNERFLKSTKSYWRAFTLFISYIAEYNLSLTPSVFLSKQNTPSFWDYLESTKTSQPHYMLTIIYEFTNWFIDGYMTDTDDGEKVSIGIEIISSHRYSHILKSQGKDYQKPTESVKLSPPTSWLFLIRDILTENDFEWPKSVSKDYFDFYNDETEKFESVWVPVNTYIILTMLELPIRKIQVISSDSGEGDEFKYNHIKKIWEENSSPHANLWKKMGAKRTNRGMVSKLPSTDPSFAGFYINTNKTQDIEDGFSETSGYNVPWNNETLIKYLSDLRIWQEKHNPVRTPTKYRKICKPIFQLSPTKAVLDSVPDRFYLFRHPNSNRGSFPDSPPTHNQTNAFFMLLMEDLEKRLNKLGESAELITHRNEKTGQPDNCIFSIHSLRVAGLTAFAEAGVPIEILSKIVAGHSSILMTIYYIKYNSVHITDVLNEAQKNTELNSQKNYSQWLRNASWEDAKKYTAYNTTDGLAFAKNNTVSSSVWGGSSLGICPYGGTRCDDGGEIIRKNAKNGKNHIYDHVPGGQGNCVRCRHFITGAPWLIPLWLHGNKLLSDAHKQSAEIDKLKSVQEKLCSQRYQYIKSGDSNSIPSELIKEINTQDAIIESKVTSLDQTLMNAHATYNLLQKVRVIISNETNDANRDEENKQQINSPIIMQEDSEIDFKETSRFVAMDTIVQAGRLYTHIQDADLERERNNFVDQILFNNNLEPISFAPLSDEEKSMASDAAAKFLISRINANEIEHLHKGHITLDSLGIGGDMQKTLSLVQKAHTPSVLPHAKIKTKLEDLS